VETIGGHGRWSSDEGSGFLSMTEGRPWEPMGGGGKRGAEVN
jgi:hypothetical protein